MYLSMKDEAKIKSKHKRKFLLKFLLQQKLDQTNRTNVWGKQKKTGPIIGYK